MGDNEMLAVDTLSLADFRRTIQARLDEAHAMLAKLDRPQSPMLGTFEDALETRQRHDVLHSEYVARLRRLIDALTAVQERTGAIIAKYESVEALNAARQRDLLQMLLSKGHG